MDVKAGALFDNIDPWYGAKLKGEIFYFTGIPCKHGHIANRYVKGRRCVICSNDLKIRTRNADVEKRYREKNKLRIRLRVYNITEQQYNDALWKQGKLNGHRFNNHNYFICKYGNKCYTSKINRRI